jgi:hypothetical protein
MSFQFHILIFGDIFPYSFGFIFANKYISLTFSGDKSFKVFKCSVFFFEHDTVYWVDIVTISYLLQSCYVSYAGVRNDDTGKYSADLT